MSCRWLRLLFGVLPFAAAQVGRLGEGSTAKRFWYCWWLKSCKKLSTENPIIYIYLQGLHMFSRWYRIWRPLTVRNLLFKSQGGQNKERGSTVWQPSGPKDFKGLLLETVSGIFVVATQPTWHTCSRTPVSQQVWPANSTRKSLEILSASSLFSSFAFHIQNIQFFNPIQQLISANKKNR